MDDINMPELSSVGQKGYKKKSRIFYLILDLEEYYLESELEKGYTQETSFVGKTVFRIIFLQKHFP